jgi:hypothetical protein
VGWLLGHQLTRTILNVEIAYSLINAGPSLLTGMQLHFGVAGAPLFLQIRSLMQSWLYPARLAATFDPNIGRH